MIFGWCSSPQIRLSNRKDKTNGWNGVPNFLDKLNQESVDHLEPHSSHSVNRFSVGMHDPKLHPRHYFGNVSNFGSFWKLHESSKTLEKRGLRLPRNIHIDNCGSFFLWPIFSSQTWALGALFFKAGGVLMDITWYDYGKKPSWEITNPNNYI